MSNASWVIETPVTMVEGEAKTFNITVPGATTIATPTCKTYNQETDTSSTNLSGTAAASGNVITTQIVGTVKGGETYVLATTATVDGNTRIFLCEIQVLHPWGT